MKNAWAALFLIIYLTPFLAFPQEAGWSPPDFSERQSDRNEMVRNQLEGRNITDENVLDAMRSAPRHLLVPEENRAQAYADTPLPIGHGQTISQPYIVAYMTQILDIEAGDKVLEIGTGSGYQAAVLAHITPNVYSIEIIEELGERARNDLQDLGYDSVTVKIADGYFGWEEHAPFDAIIVTAASGHVPPPLVDQLKPGGKMVIPIGGIYQTQNLMEVTKSEEGDLSTKSLMAVRFVPMMGEAQN
ncbi:protein-L-isoaspartate(D-aspartate) O-methyltransferase [Rhodohalobacter sp. 8-1]|uniref:protein-L-isoaspartate(D-aspartate) O-methyltransferase n=1 Tax=Rhodohalobacter sp. 8-1 TaxID=3131972 RepID=UPI0030EF9E63